MAKKSRKISKNKNNYFAPLAIISVGMLIIFGALLMILTKQADTISKYELLEKIDNQACRYLDGQKSVNGSFNLDVSAPEGKPKLAYQCLTGEETKAKTIHGKPIGQYWLGATVLYFSDNEAAETYAKKELNPLRYWSDENPNQIQNKNYTFLVTDEKTPYFDAYRVRANAVVRVSLACDNKSYDACDMRARSLLDRELKGINVL